MRILYIHDESFQARSNIVEMSKHFDIVEYFDGCGRTINANDFTHIIQHLHPKFWAKYGPMRHIGWLDYVIDDYVENTCFVDQIWAPNEEIIDNLYKKFTHDMVKLDHMIDPEIYKKNQKFQEISEVRGTFSFFVSSIGVKRPNIDNILRAYWEEFDPTEPVSLILNNGPDSGKTVEFARNQMNLYDNNVYQKIILIDNKLSADQEIGILQNIVGCVIKTDKSWIPFDAHCENLEGIIIQFDNSSSIQNIKMTMRDVYIHSFTYQMERYSDNNRSIEIIKRLLK